jgi:hypothetical protein
MDALIVRGRFFAVTASSAWPVRCPPLDVGSQPFAVLPNVKQEVSRCRVGCPIHHGAHLCGALPPMLGIVEG